MQSRMISPAFLLASFLLPGEAEAKLIFITGPSGCGKTRYCLELAHRARENGIPLAGVVSPPIYESGKKKLLSTYGSRNFVDRADYRTNDDQITQVKWGIDLEDLASGERRRLAVRREAPQEGLATADWQFDEAVLVWGNERLASCRSGGPLLILDELGPLEFERGLGFQAGLQLLDEGRFHLAVAVVRPALLPLARQRWPWGWAGEATLGGSMVIPEEAG